MSVIVFVTGEYPFGTGETFIENEITALSNVFDNVLIYASEVSDSTDDMRTVPENVSVFASGCSPVSKNNYKKSLRKKSVLREIKDHCLGSNTIGKISACCYFDQSVSESSKNISKFVDNNLDLLKNNKVIIYSYWLSNIGMTALNIYDNVKNVNSDIHIVSRCHRFDLYDERAYLNYQPFKSEMIRRIERIFPCSEQGSDYLKRQYPEYSDKIQTSYLGVVDLFNGVLPAFDNILHIASCSNVIPVKRVDKILSALKCIDKPVRWTHFGDGELFDELRESVKSLPENITVDLRGRVPNFEIYSFYQNENVNLFINVSSSEGLPVSIMEAVSFGIPIIATDVGGTKEIVLNNYNGVLLNEIFSNDDLVNAINLFISMNEIEYSNYCKNSRMIYENKFSINNYYNFCKMLLS